MKFLAQNRIYSSHGVGVAVVVVPADDDGICDGDVTVLLVVVHVVQAPPF